MPEDSDIPIIYGIHQDPLHDLEELREEVQAMMEKGENPPAVIGEEVEISNRLHNTMLAFVALAVAALENKTASILIHEVVDDDIRNPEVADFFRDGSRFNQHRREELLYRADVIDGNLKHRMAKLRSPRNKLVHEVHGRFEFLDDYAEAQEYMNDTIDTLEELNCLIDQLWDD